MILRQMRYFAAVAEHGGVGRAASALRVAQPALSRQIHALEREVGAPLLVRERRGVTLTPAGTVLLDGVRALREQLERAVRRTRLAHEGRLGTLRLGLGRIAVENSGISRAIAELRDQFPEIELVVDEVPSLSQAASLRAGKLNLAIGIEGASRDESLRRETIFPDSVDRALLPAAHPLVTFAAIHPSQLRTERLMMLRAAIAPFPELYESLRQLGFSEWEEHESHDTVYGLVAAGHGWTTHVRSLPAPPGTVAVPLTGLAVPLSIVVRWNADDESPLTSNVVDVFRRNGNGGSSATRTGVRAPSRRRTAGRVTSQETRQLNLELRHLRALVVTMEEGSVSQAAQRLRLSQSGLARQLRALEREVGFPVLRRGASGIATLAAEVLKTEASAAIAIIEAVLSHARRTSNGISGTCNIGAIPPELSGSLLSGVLRQVSMAFPNIAVEVREILTPRQLPALRSGEIDLGIASAIPGLVDDPAIASFVLLEDVVECALVSSANPLASRDMLKPSDLARLPFYFIDRPTYPKLYDLVLETFGQLGLEPMMTGSFNGPRSVWQLAADSMGWTIGARSFRAHPPPGTVAVPIEGFQIPTGAALLWRRDEKDPSILALIDVFRSARAGHLPDLPVRLDQQVTLREQR